MVAQQAMRRCEVGIVGPARTGTAVALSLTRSGHTVACLSSMLKAPSHERIVQCESPDQLAQTVSAPRKIFFCYETEEAVSDGLGGLIPFLGEDDILLDLTYTHFQSAERRARKISSKGFSYLGLGLIHSCKENDFASGLMISGDPRLFTKIKPLLENLIGFQGDSEPVVAFVGPRGAGHYAQMAFQGVLQSEIRLVEDAVEVLRRLKGCSSNDIAERFSQWWRNGSASWLYEISSQRLVQTPGTADPLKGALGKIQADQPSQQWLLENIRDLELTLPSFTAALQPESAPVGQEPGGVSPADSRTEIPEDNSTDSALIQNLEQSILAARGAIFHQAVVLLQTASKAYNYRFNLASLFDLWHEGSALRSKLLDKIRDSLKNEAEPITLNKSSPFVVSSDRILDGWTRIVNAAAEREVPCPVLTASRRYWDES